MSASTTSSNVTVSWDVIECIERNGVITGYTVEFQKQDGTNTRVVNAAGQTFTASGLTPHTNNTFRVAGVNNNGTGPYSDAITILTDEDSKFSC